MALKVLHQESEAREYRKFILKLGEKLTKEDTNKICFLEGLPKEVEDKAPWKVLNELAMHGRISISDHEELISILKVINRHDTVEMVREFANNQKKMYLQRQLCDVKEACATSQSLLGKLSNELWEIMSLSSSVREQLEKFKHLAEVEGIMEVKHGVDDMIAIHKSVHSKLCMNREGRNVKIVFSLMTSSARNLTESSINGSQREIVQTPSTNLSTALCSFPVKNSIRPHPVVALLPKSSMIPKFKGCLKQQQEQRSKTTRRKTPILPPDRSVKTGSTDVKRSHSVPIVTQGNNSSSGSLTESLSLPVNSKLSIHVHGGSVSQVGELSSQRLKPPGGKPIPPPKPKKLNSPSATGGEDTIDQTQSDYSKLRPFTNQTRDSGFVESQIQCF